MKQSLFFPFLLGTYFYSCGQSLSPEVVSSAGKYFTTSEAQLSWTLGETVTATFVAGDFHVLTQGFHQTNLIITSVKELAPAINLEVFPNPTSNILQVRWEALPEDLILELLDLQGRPLQRASLVSQSTSNQLDLSSYPAGTYLLRIRTDKQLIKTCQITKIK